MKKYLIYVAVLFLSGCATLGLETAKSFPDRLAYAEGWNTAMRDASSDALDHHEITSDDMEYVINVNEQAKAILESARLFIKIDLTVAENKLLVATKLLTDLQTYLRSRKVKLSLEEPYPWVMQPMLL